MSTLVWSSNVAALGFDLLRPSWSAFALAGPLVLLVGTWAIVRRRRARLALVAERHQLRFLPLYSENRARLRAVLAGLAASLIGLALIGPVRGYTLREVQRKGLDLVVCVDTSRSMLAQDVKPDRLTRAKREVNGLLNQLKGDRAALMAFAGDVRDVAPLTHDRGTLAMFVNALTPDDNLRGGTDLGGALERALALFDGRTGAHEAIVLLTDGEDLEGHGLEVAKKARERGIRVYVVGVGTIAGGKIPELNGGRAGFVHDETGAEVVTALDGKDLKTLAESTGGAYLSVESSPLPLEEIYQKRIGQLEGRALEGGKEKIPHDRYQWPLVLAALCMLGELGLRERRSTPRAPARSVAVGVQRGAA